MAGPAIVFDPALAAYDFGPEHPLRPERVTLFIDTVTSSGMTESIPLVAPRPYELDDILRVHSERYVDALLADDRTSLIFMGFGISDNPFAPGIGRAAAAVCGATVTAASLVAEGHASHVFSPAGGLHHAHRDAAAGFCVLNDVAVAAAYLRDVHAMRVAYIDIDAHHADGVEEAFYDDDRVLVISIHETGRFLFPGTGEAADRGAGQGYGFTINVPIAPGTMTEDFIAYFEASVPQALALFDPDVLLVQFGADGHALDPMAHLALAPTAYRTLARRLDELAHETAHGRIIATGGGGYDVRCTARAWIELAAALGHLSDDDPRYVTAIDGLRGGCPDDADVPYLQEIDMASSADNAIRHDITISLEVLEAQMSRRSG